MRKVFIIACTLLAACSSGYHAPETAVEPPKFSIRGTVTGLTGSGLTLRNNGGDELAVAASGPFRFATPLSATRAFDVNVQTQPGNPSQQCVVTNGAGVVGTGDVTNIAVTCSAGGGDDDDDGDDEGPYIVSGTVSGLQGVNLILQLGGHINALPILSNGRFEFEREPLLRGVAFNVGVRVQPHEPDQICTVANGVGIIGVDDASQVEVTCGNVSPGRVWHHPETVVTGAGVANGRAAVDATGNITVVWQLSLGQQEGQIWARRYSRSTGWQDAQRIDTIDNRSTDPQVTVDGAGNALVLWTDHEQGIWSRRYDVPSGTWDEIKRVDADGAGDRVQPQLAQAPGGAALALWVLVDANNSRVFAVEHASGHGVGSSWSVPVSLQPEGSSNGGHARLAMNRNGGAIAVWGNAEGRIQASVYDATQWQAPVIISGMGDEIWASAPQIAISEDHALASWQQTNIVNNQVADGVSSNRWHNGAWAGPRDLSTDAGFDARVAVNQSGDAVVAWRRDMRVRARYFDSKQDAWDVIESLDEQGWRSRFARPAIDADGNAFVAWERSTQIDSGCCTGLFSRRHVVAGGWQETLGHGSFGLINGESLDIATHPDGDMAMIFQQRLVGDTIRIVRYQ